MEEQHIPDESRQELTQEAETEYTKKNTGKFKRAMSLFALGLKQMWKKHKKLTIFLVIILIIIGVKGVNAVSESGIFKSNETKFNEAMAMIEAAETVEDYQAAIAALEKVDENYDGVVTEIEKAKKASDKLVLSDMKQKWNSDSEAFQNLQANLYNKMAGEKAKEWLLFYDRFSSEVNAIRSAFQWTLKDPTSYVDLGSNYVYEVLSYDSDSVKIQFTLTIYYSATNSFGGRLQDVQQMEPVEFVYKFSAKGLTEEERKEIVETSDYDIFCNKILEEDTNTETL
ncbi:MAG: hypothetical protein KH282_06990 [Clostridiales bacterium]|nr:hypothetical protein [Clostridiales bacterium]